MNAIASEQVALDVPGWFGKLACLGDFASRRLPGDFTGACDGWLSRGIAASRAQLGERWLDTYLTSPLWRFAWAPGVIDAQWWFGVVMPSVDKVGRYFPLLVALPRAQALHYGDALDRLEQWFADVSEAALGTLHAGATVQRFEDALRAAAPLPERHDDASQAQQWMGRTLWWPQGSRAGEERPTVVDGLPAADSFGRLLQGAW